MKNDILQRYSDAANAFAWARSSITENVQAGIVLGRNGTVLASKALNTRAGVAVIVQRLLQKSGLI